MILYASKQNICFKPDPQRRYLFLDELRGFSLLSMIVYHLCWNLDNLMHIELSWYDTFGARIWQFSICGVFLLLAGLCIHFTRRLVRHTLLLAGCALLISLVTWFTGTQTLVVFGILHCMTLCFLCYFLLRPILSRISPIFGLTLCLFLFLLTYRLPYHYLGFGPMQIALPDKWYAFYWLSPIGLLSPDFYSSDYFPLFPNLFLFLAGYFLGFFSLPEWMRRSHCRPLAWLGQHSLFLYLIHQPILYLCMLPFFP